MSGDAETKGPKILEPWMRTLTFTAVYLEGEKGGIVAYIEELPGAHAQGRTIEEARDRLDEPLSLMLRQNRRLNRKSFEGAREVRREQYVFRR